MLLLLQANVNHGPVKTNKVMFIGKYICLINHLRVPLIIQKPSYDVTAFQ